MNILEQIQIELKIQQELINKINNMANLNRTTDLKDLIEYRETLALITESLNKNVNKLMSAIDSNSSLKMTLRHYLSLPEKTNLDFPSK